MSPEEWVIQISNMIECFNRQGTRVFNPLRNKFHLNRTQNSGSCLTENTVWIYYREKSIYPVTDTTRIDCENHMRHTPYVNTLCGQNVKLLMLL